VADIRETFFLQERINIHGAYIHKRTLAILCEISSFSSFVKPLSSSLLLYLPDYAVSGGQYVLRVEYNSAAEVMPRWDRLKGYLKRRAHFMASLNREIMRTYPRISFRSRSIRVDLLLLSEKERRWRIPLGIIATRIPIFIKAGDITIAINDSPGTGFHLAWHFFLPQSWDPARRAGLRQQICYIFLKKFAEESVRDKYQAIAVDWFVSDSSYSPWQIANRGSSNNNVDVITRSVLFFRETCVAGVIYRET